MWHVGRITSGFRHFHLLSYKLSTGREHGITMRYTYDRAIQQHMDIKCSSQHWWCILRVLEHEPEHLHRFALLQWLCRDLM